jgi:hypothetical protein
MASDDIKAKPVFDKGADVVTTGVEAMADRDGKGRIGLRELLITILAPTLALIGVAVGVWDNARSEEAARKRDEAIRIAGLVLPYYEKVMVASDAVAFAERECDAAWLALDFEEADAGGGEDAFSAIDQACGPAFRSALADLDSALNQALLVSDENLLPVVERYQEVQTDFAEIATFVNSDDSLELAEDEFDQLFEDYFVIADELASVREELVEVVRAQVLLQPTR